MAKAHEAEEKERIVDRISRYIYASRYFLIVLLIVFLAAVIGYFAYSEISKNVREKSTRLVESAQVQYQAWLIHEDGDEKDKTREGLIAELDQIIAQYPRQYAAQRALFIKGSLFFEEKQWEGALIPLLQLADSFPQSYLAQEALFFSGIASEELGNLSQALELYQRLTEEYPRSPRLPHALFSQGRLLEIQGDKDEALRIYNILKLDHSYSNWTKLAVNRIIELQSAGEVEE